MPLKYEVDVQARRNKKADEMMTKNIKVSDDVHHDLGELGKLSESYNDVIRRLIDHYKNSQKGK